MGREYWLDDRDGDIVDVVTPPMREALIAKGGWNESDWVRVREVPTEKLTGAPTTATAVRRERIATALLTGMADSVMAGESRSMKDHVDRAIEVADILIRRLER